MCYVLAHVWDAQLNEILQPEETGIPDMACEQPTERNWTQRSMQQKILLLNNPVMRGLISLWLYKENNKLWDWKKCIYSTYSFLISTHLWLRCSKFFNPSKKNSLGCAANRKKPIIQESTQQVDASGNAPGLYSSSPQFGSPQGQYLSWERMIFSSPSMQMLEHYVFLPHLSKFIINF
jgi:hypothetical protein